MKRYNDYYIIGVDAGYGNMKTAQSIFPTGLIALDSDPMYKGNFLKYNGIWYRIGAGHKPFINDKTEDDEFYILTLAYIASELNTVHVSTADVLLAVGLPTTWTSYQREKYREYMLKNRDVKFTFNDVDYHIRFVDCMVFPQGYSAVVQSVDNDLRNNGFRIFSGTVMMADIGNGTMNMMRLQNGRPDERFIWTETLGVNQCVLAVKKRMMDAYGLDLPDETIDEFLRTKTANLPEECVADLINVAARYVTGLFDSLRSHGYDPRIMKLIIVGGGGCLVKNFGKYNPASVLFENDIHASAKGFEYMAQGVLWKKEAG